MKKSKQIKIFTISLLLCLLLSLSCVRAYSNNMECSTCHEGVGFKLADSSHANVSCTECHNNTGDGKHPPGIPENNASAVNTSCDRCHTEEAHIYIESVHGDAGKYERLACNSCHGGHEIVDINAPASPVNQKNINSTCIQCHRGQLIQNYNESIHGRVANLGDKTAPDCVSCHSNHGINNVTRNDGSVETAVVSEIC